MKALMLVAFGLMAGSISYASPANVKCSGKDALPVLAKGTWNEVTLSRQADGTYSLTRVLNTNVPTEKKEKTWSNLVCEFHPSSTGVATCMGESNDKGVFPLVAFTQIDETSITLFGQAVRNSSMEVSIGYNIAGSLSTFEEKYRFRGNDCSVTL